MDEDLAFNYACWKYVGTGEDRRLAEVLVSTIYGQEALSDFLDTADGRIWPPHVERDDDFGAPAACHPAGGGGSLSCAPQPNSST